MYFYNIKDENLKNNLKKKKNFGWEKPFGLYFSTEVIIFFFNWPPRLNKINLN